MRLIEVFAVAPDEQSNPNPGYSLALSQTFADRAVFATFVSKETAAAWMRSRSITGQIVSLNGKMEER